MGYESRNIAFEIAMRIARLFSRRTALSPGGAQHRGRRRRRSEPSCSIARASPRFLLPKTRVCSDLVHGQVPRIVNNLEICRIPGLGGPQSFHRGAGRLGPCSRMTFERPFFYTERGRFRDEADTRLNSKFRGVATDA